MLPRTRFVYLLSTFILSFACYLLPLLRAEAESHSSQGRATGQKATIKEELSDWKSGSVLVLDMDLPILPGTQGFLEDGLEVAEAEGFRLVVVQLSTPGGMLMTTQDMVQAIFASPIPVVFYVAPAGATATSAGVFLTLAAHVAVMSPGSSIGSAHPVNAGGQDLGDDMRDKAENMATAMIQSIAKERGRNAKWAEKAVRKSISVPVETALKKGIVDFSAEDLSELLAKLKGKVVKLPSGSYRLPDFSDQERVNFPISIKYRVLNFLADPNVVAILMLIATTGIVIELYNPGLIFPGVLGAVCLILGLTSLQVMALSSGAMMLLLLGVVLIIAEVIVPSGILVVLGGASIVIGLIYLGSGGEGWFVVDRFSIGVIAFALAIVGYFIGVKVKQVHQKTPITGSEMMDGAVGEVISLSGDLYQVRVNGEIWQAKSVTDLIKVGDEVEVTGRDSGLTLLVKLKSS